MHTNTNLTTGITRYISESDSHFRMKLLSRDGTLDDEVTCDGYSYDPRSHLTTFYNSQGISIGCTHRINYDVFEEKNKGGSEKYRMYRVPCRWEMHGYVDIFAQNADDALKKALSDDFCLPQNGEYTSDSFVIDEEQEILSEL